MILCINLTFAHNSKSYITGKQLEQNETNPLAKTCVNHCGASPKISLSWLNIIQSLIKNI